MISADEKTSIQARARKHRSARTRPGLPMKAEHEYKRLGAWAYLAALDVHRFRIFGRKDLAVLLRKLDHSLAAA